MSDDLAFLSGSSYPLLGHESRERTDHCKTSGFGRLTHFPALILGSSVWRDWLPNLSIITMGGEKAKERKSDERGRRASSYGDSASLNRSTANRFKELQHSLRLRAFFW